MGTVTWGKVSNASGILLSDCVVKCLLHSQLTLHVGVVEGLVPVFPLRPCKVVKALEQSSEPSFS